MDHVRSLVRPQGQTIRGLVRGRRVRLRCHLWFLHRPRRLLFHRRRLDAPLAKRRSQHARTKRRRFHAVRRWTTDDQSHGHVLQRRRSAGQEEQVGSEDVRHLYGLCATCDCSHVG